LPATDVHDDAGAFPRFDEAFARFARAELHNEVIQVAQLIQHGGRVNQPTIVGMLPGHWSDASQ